MPQDAFTEKTEALAAEVLALSRNTLLVRLRFLGAALGRLAAETKRLPDGLETDGRVLYYDPGALLRAYQAGRGVPARDLLHCVLHCVLRHFSVPEGAARDVWDLACDVAAEHMIAELSLPALSAPREARQRKTYELLQTAGVPLTAEKLYRYFLSQLLSPEEARALRAAFRADGHRLWHERDAAKAAETEAVWREVSRRMQVELETFARRRGGAALMLGLREANREVSDYAGFLRKFAARGEPMRLDADEFDYGLYSYGLQLYGGSVPLIEPVEYRETRRVRDFAVVTAFSEAFPAETARRLLETTRAQLTASGTASSRVALRVLPGGADARLAFRDVDGLCRRGELKNLKGLLFLTDGIEAFPANMPAYPAAFVFVNDDYSVPEVPPWAIRTVLQRDEI